MKKRLGKSGKRMAAAVMAAVLAFGLTACGDSGSSSANSGERLRRQERYSRKEIRPEPMKKKRLRLIFSWIPPERIR